MKLWENTPLFNPEYGNEQPELHFLPAETERAVGCVIICAGGSYRIRAYHEAYPYAEVLNAAGIHAAVLDYRVAPYHYPAQLYDVQRAIRTVRYNAKEWNVLPDKIAVCGSSAGGHLAVMAAEHFDYGKEDGDDIDKVSCRPDAAVLCYPVATLGEYTHAGTKKNITLGDEALARKLTGEKNVGDDCPPMFIWHTAEDDKVPVQNSLMMAAALSEKKIPYELHIFPDGRHGVGLCEESLPHTAQWSALLVKWLEKLGF